MKDFSAGFWVGVVLMMIPLCIVANNFISYREKPDSIIAECEKDLPRPQKCVLIAVPEKETKGENK